MKIKINFGQHTWHSYGVRSVLALNTINIALLRSEDFGKRPYSISEILKELK